MSRTQMNHRIYMTRKYAEDVSRVMMYLYDHYYHADPYTSWTDWLKTPHGQAFVMLWNGWKIGLGRDLDIRPFLAKSTPISGRYAAVRLGGHGPDTSLAS